MITATVTDTGISEILMRINDRFVCYVGACGYANMQFKELYAESLYLWP